MVTSDSLDPYDATPAQLAGHFEGRPLWDPQRYQRKDWCKRCDEKNTTRFQYDLDPKDEAFEDSERIRFHASFEGFETPDEQMWRITGVYHLRHPHESKEEVAMQGVALVRGTATLEPEDYVHQVDVGSETITRLESDERVLRDVEIEFYSPPDEGADPDSAPEPEEDLGTVVLEPTDPRPHWPDEENEWREKLMREHDDWNGDLPTYHLGPSEDA